MYEVIIRHELPFPPQRNFASALHELQFYFFLQMLSILIDGDVPIPFGLSAAYVTAVGKRFREDHGLDVQELMARYLYVLFLSKPVDAEVWGKGCFGLMLPKSRLNTAVWWKNLQEVLRKHPDRGFCEEYCCTIGLPLGARSSGPGSQPSAAGDTSMWTATGSAAGPTDEDFRRELQVIEERFRRGCVRVSPELPDHQFWLYHDTCVPSETGLLYPRVLPPLRPSAPLFSGTWGCNDGQQYGVNRWNMIKETHVFLQADKVTRTHRDRFGASVEVVESGACIPEELFLEELLGNELRQKLLAAFRKSRLPAPWWLSSARGDVTRADDAASARGDVTRADDAEGLPPPPPVTRDSETADCLAAVQYQILGNLFLSSLRPENVFHPHLRGHFEYHVGRLLAVEMYFQATFRVAAIDFLEGCGVKFGVGGGWQQRMLEKRPRVVPALHSLNLHTAWGDKCRAQRYCDNDEDRIWLVALGCQQQETKERRCESHLEVCGYGTVCNLRHSLTERHGRQLMFSALQYLDRQDMDVRGKADETGLGFVATLLSALGYVCPANEQYHRNPERRFQLFKQPRWYPRSTRKKRDSRGRT